MKSVRYDIRWKPWLAARDAAEHPEYEKIRAKMFGWGLPELANAHIAIRTALENEIC